MASISYGFAGILFGILSVSKVFWGKRMLNETKLLPNVSVAGLKALASGMLAPQAQSHLDDLLARNSEGKLTEQETKKLDALIEQIDELNLLKARAAFTLQHQDDAS
jgi:hypothetical protein